MFLQKLNPTLFLRAVTLNDKVRYQQVRYIVVPDEKSAHRGTDNESITLKSKTGSQSTVMEQSSKKSAYTTDNVPMSTVIHSISTRVNSISSFSVPNYSIGKNLICDNETKILVYFQSKWEHVLKRRNLRQTWASAFAYNNGRQMKFAFILGKPTDVNDQVKINNEQMLHGDIIEGDFIDSVRNLTFKSVIVMDFIERSCKYVKYIIKADDDIFLNLFVVMQKVLPTINPEERVIACHVIESGKSPIGRDKASNWYIPPNIFTNRTYLPQFCSGYMVIMTWRLVRDLYSTAKVSPLVGVDDVYMFGQLTQDMLNIKFINLKQNLTLAQDIGLQSYRNGRSHWIAVNVASLLAMEEIWSLTLMQNYQVYMTTV